MKTIVISQKGKELSRFIPEARSTLVGRSPSCDVVMRSKSVKPVHFLLEWVGEGEFNPNQGLWTIVNLAKKSKDERDIGEGLVLSAESIKSEQFEFKIVEDELAESQLRRGVLTRKIEEIKMGDGSARSNTSVAEVIYFRKDIESVVNVKHFDRRWPIVTPFPSLPQVKFTWPRQMSGIGFLENQGEKKEFHVYNRGQDITRSMADRGKKIEIRSADFISLETSDYEYYVRMVQPVKVEVIPLAWLRDPTVRSILFILFLIGLLSIWMSQRPPEPNIEIVEPPRVATVQIQDLSKAPPPAVEEPKAAPVEEPKETVPEVKKAAPKTESPIVQSQPKEARPSAPSVKNVPKTEKKQAGLNSPAPIKDVNTVGILAKLKGGANKSGQKVSADLIVNKGIVTDPAAGNSGIVVSQPPSGELGKGKGGGGPGGGGLVAASTTLKNSGVVDEDSVGALAMAGAKGKSSGGLNLGGKDGVGSGKAGLGGEGSMEVAGGLTKDAVRKAISENRRAIGSCYESALLARKDLEGRVTLRWKITPDGPVDSIVIQSATTNMSSFENCVMRVVKGIIFPRAPNKLPTTVIFPFVFQGKK